jgi:multiple sugar transport system permease protein
LAAARAEGLAAWRLTAPAVLLLAVLILAPTLAVLGFSLTDYELGYDGITFIGLDNYVELLGDRTFLISL